MLFTVNVHDGMLDKESLERAQGYRQRDHEWASQANGDINWDAKEEVVMASFKKVHGYLLMMHIFLPCITSLNLWKRKQQRNVGTGELEWSTKVATTSNDESFMMLVLQNYWEVWWDCLENDYKKTAMSMEERPYFTKMKDKGGNKSDIRYGQWDEAKTFAFMNKTQKEVKMDRQTLGEWSDTIYGLFMKVQVDSGRWTDSDQKNQQVLDVDWSEQADI